MMMVLKTLENFFNLSPSLPFYLFSWTSIKKNKHKAQVSLFMKRPNLGDGSQLNIARPNAVSIANLLTLIRSNSKCSFKFNHLKFFFKFGLKLYFEFINSHLLMGNERISTWVKIFEKIWLIFYFFY